MTTIRKIVTSKIDGGNADSNDINEIRPSGETAFYLDTSGNTDKLTLMMFDGVRTNQRSKVLSPGVLFGSNADSSDGAGLDTIKLIPDSRLHYNFGDYGNDQYLVIDPTAPNHVHIRAGGPIDNSNADLFLGGELTHVKVSDGYDNVVIRTSTLGEGITPHSWTFGANGVLSFPDGTESSGQGIWPPTNNGLGITLTRNVEISAVAAVTSGEGVLYVNISENDDISVVDIFWQLNTGTPTAPILIPVTGAMTPTPSFRRIDVPGVTFVEGETYTFRRNSIDAVDWLFQPAGELRTPGLGTISHQNNDLKVEVSGTDVIVLRTAGGDLVMNSDAGLMFNDGTIQRTAYLGSSLATVAKTGSGIPGTGEVATITLSPTNNTNFVPGTYPGIFLGLGPGFTLTVDVAANGDLTATVFSSNGGFYGNETGSLNGVAIAGGTTGIDDIGVTVATLTNVATATALDLTKQVQKLTDGFYTLADGVEGQIMYLVRQTGAAYNAIMVRVANARVNGLLNTAIAYLPFQAGDGVTPFDMDTLIFTDGAWQANSGSWD